MYKNKTVLTLYVTWPVQPSERISQAPTKDNRRTPRSRKGKSWKPFWSLLRLLKLRLCVKWYLWNSTHRLQSSSVLVDHKDAAKVLRDPDFSTGDFQIRWNAERGIETVAEVLGKWKKFCSAKLRGKWGTSSIVSKTSSRVSCL